ncbi:hypothetical protein SISNIDRAFT_487251 [Sistotremastrum niveocremeum HHB9708]|uniref:Uncharacterized protein n=1 Tax=Sistotremastrum niveocremeum HHB9708 TaxID=1314777 RepID=A0A164SKQ8_9AGAM|nr:hypothetical protein SISNIDRAFT_487251 [Sistotremastrum niveocremeum HHB9708]
MAAQNQWQDFQRHIAAHQFTTTDYLNQLNELAQQNHITLAWTDTEEGPNHQKVWQSYPTVGNTSLQKYLGAGVKLDIRSMGRVEPL